MTAIIEDFATARAALLKARGGAVPEKPAESVVVVSDDDDGFAMASFDLAPSPEVSPAEEAAEKILEAVRYALTRAQLRDPAFLD